MFAVDLRGEERDFLGEREDDLRLGCSPSVDWHRVSDFLCRSPMSNLLTCVVIPQ